MGNAASDWEDQLERWLKPFLDCLGQAHGGYSSSIALRNSWEKRINGLVDRLRRRLLSTEGVDYENRRLRRKRWHDVWQ
jgi:hypothetical protein